LSTFRDDVAGAAVELARSLWAELGVNGVPRRHDWQALDLEPLIICTACCLVANTRFRARTIDCCIANSRYISMLRLDHLARQTDPDARSAIDRYVASIEKGSRPAAGVAPDLRRPSLIQLRLRALAGVTARAEVLKLLLASPEQPC